MLVSLSVNADLPVAPANVAADDGNPSPTSNFGDVFTAALQPAALHTAAVPANDGTSLPGDGEVLPVELTVPADTLAFADAANNSSTLDDLAAATTASLEAAQVADDGSASTAAADAAAQLLAAALATTAPAPPMLPVGEVGADQPAVESATNVHQDTTQLLAQLAQVTAAAAHADGVDQPAGDAPTGDGATALPLAIAATHTKAEASAAADAARSLANLVDNSDNKADISVVAAATGDAPQQGGAGQQPFSDQNANQIAGSPSATRGALAALADSIGHAPDLATSVAQRIHWMSQHGLQMARIEVTPRQLGPIEIQLSQSDNAVSVSITAQHPATRELLDASAARLRDMFAADGVALQRFDVGGRESNQSGRQFEWQSNGQSSGHDNVTDDNELPTAVPLRINLNLVDAYA